MSSNCELYSKSMSEYGATMTDCSENAKKMQIHVALEWPTLILMHQQDMNSLKCSKLKLSVKGVG